MEGETLPAERPLCSHHDHDRRMELRPLEQQTYEQKFCGVWYDCPEQGCGNSRLYESDDLKAQLAEQETRRDQTELALGAAR